METRLVAGQPWPGPTSILALEEGEEPNDGSGRWQRQKHGESPCYSARTTALPALTEKEMRQPSFRRLPKLFAKTEATPPGSGRREDALTAYATLALPLPPCGAVECSGSTVCRAEGEI